MAAPTLEELLAPPTSDDAMATLLQRLSGQGFPVTTWQSGDPARTLLQLFADGFADFGTLMVAIASGGFAALATGDWLTLVAKQVYGLDREDATFTQGTCVLTCTATAPGYTIQAGQLVGISAGGLRFANTTGGNLEAGGTLNVTFQGESPGSAYNVSINTITELGTPLPGVTINNPDAGSGTWITQVGTDEESDASLQGRCAARWPSLATVATLDVFDLWAKAASNQVTRTLAQTDATVAGQVNLWLAGASGGVAAGVVTAVQAYVDARMLLTSVCVAASATNEPVELQATLYVKAGFEATAIAYAQRAAEWHISSAAINGTLYLSDLEGELQKPTKTDAVTGLPVLDANDEPISLTSDATGIRNVNIAVFARQSVGAGVGDIDLSAISGGPHVATPVVTLNTVTV